MNTTGREIIRLTAIAALIILIITSLIWWMYALSDGVFAIGPFIGLTTGLTIAGITGRGSDHE